MPTMNKSYSLTITPEQFLDACDSIELKEVELLIQSPRYQERIPPEEEEEETKTLNLNEEF